MTRRLVATSPFTVSLGRVLGFTALTVMATACGPTISEGSSRYARPWKSELASLFDNQNDVCTPWVGSSELWAGNEKHRLAQRTSEADIIAVAHVQALVRTDDLDETKQESLQIDVQEMIRGSTGDLPEGSPRVTLPLSAEQEARITGEIIGRQAVLFLRWVPGPRLSFRWHLACAMPGVVDQTKVFLKARQKGETPP